MRNQQMFCVANLDADGETDDWSSVWRGTCSSRIPSFIKVVIATFFYNVIRVLAMEFANISKLVATATFLNGVFCRSRRRLADNRSEPI